MELSQTEIIQRKREIDELANLHQLEDWQKDRLFQEFVRRKSMGYAVSLIEIAKEWGWIESADTPVEPTQTKETLDAEKSDATPVAEVKPETPAIPATETVQTPDVSQPVVEAKQEIAPIQEAILQETMQPTPVEARQEQQIQPQQQEQQPQQPEQVQYPQLENTEQAQQQYDYADNYNKDSVVGYKLPSGIYNDPEKIAQQAKGGALEEASTWISTKLSQLFGISSAA